MYSAIHVGSCWKIWARRQIKNTQTKYNSEKANNAKHTNHCRVTARLDVRLTFQVILEISCLTARTQQQRAIILLM